LHKTNENRTKINDNRRISGKNLDISGMPLIFAASFFEKTEVKIKLIIVL